VFKLQKAHHLAYDKNFNNDSDSDNEEYKRKRDQKLEDLKDYYEKILANKNETIDT